MASKYVRNLQDEDEVIYEGKGKKPMGSGADTGAKKSTPKKVVETVKTIGRKATSKDSGCTQQ